VFVGEMGMAATTKNDRKGPSDSIKILLYYFVVLLK
jgi:hypothetical protein